MGRLWWVDRAEFERYKARSEAYERVVEGARRRIARELRLRVEAERRASEMAEKVVALANRPAHVIQPPDTAKIVKEAIEGMATVLNGWKDRPIPDATVQMPLSMEQQGLDDRAGIPQSLQSFIPPWEDGFPDPSRAEFVNAAVGNYKPYIPGEGNTTQPKGGME